MRNPAIEELQDPSRYNMIEELRYDSIIPFVFKNIGNKTLAGIFYRWINIFLAFFVLIFSIYGFRTELFDTAPYLRHLLWAIFSGTLLVIPLHEGLHALAYRISGAPRVYFGMDLKQMLFYVSTHRYVVGRKQFYFVALTPFAFINLAGLIILFFSNPYITLFIGIFLLLHNLMCIGDFAMVSFFEKRKNSNLYTYDEHFQRTSYIFEEADSQ
jgi:hypothetical protein